MGKIGTLLAFAAVLVATAVQAQGTGYTWVLDRQTYVLGPDEIGRAHV